MTKILKKVQFLDSLTLKIIATILMTVDHIGFFMFHPDSSIYEILRTIGRLALPLFCFLSALGSIYSRKPLTYAIRLIVLGVIIDLCIFAFSQDYVGNALTSLGVGSLAIYFMKKKNYYSLIAIPLMVLACLTDFNFFPIRMDGGGLAFFLIVGYYFAHILAERNMDIALKQNDFDEETISLIKAEELQTRRNINYFLATILVFIVFMFIDLFNLNFAPLENILPFSMESYASLAALFFLFYNGKKGYSHKYLKLSFYIYYPLHVVVLFLIAFIFHLGAYTL